MSPGHRVKEAKRRARRVLRIGTEGGKDGVDRGAVVSQVDAGRIFAEPVHPGVLIEKADDRRHDQGAERQGVSAGDVHPLSLGAEAAGRGLIDRRQTVLGIVVGYDDAALGIGVAAADESDRVHIERIRKRDGSIDIACE